MSELTAQDAARRLSVSSREVNRLIHNGSLRGRKLGTSTSAWLIDSRSISEYTRIKKASGRSWGEETSWALLNVLSGVEQQLHPVTKTRIAERIRQSTAEEIVRKTASRVVARRFLAEDKVATARDLILTGESAASKVSAELVGRSSTVEGYVRGQDLAGFIQRHLLIEDTDGDVIIYDTDYEVGDQLAEAVVAVDLARSLNTRAQAAALQSLEILRRRWIASHS